MDPQLLTLIETFQISVAEAMQMLESNGICTRPTSRTQWRLNGMPRTGEIGSNGRYRKLAAGVSVEYNGQSVNFDFGHEGEIDGFDLWRLQQFVDLNARPNPLGNDDALIAAFDRAVAEREIIERRDSVFYLR